MARRRYGVLLLVAALPLALAAACSDETDPVTGGSSPEAGPPTPTGTEDSGDGRTTEAPPAEELVVVGHATRPQLRLTRSAADRLLSGEVRRWRGLRVARSVRAVERDPGTIAVVPIDAVGPTVVVASVAGTDPVRDHADALTVAITGDLMLVRNVPDPAASLAPFTPLLRRADLAVGNLESTLSTNGAPTQGNDSFGGSPTLVPLLRKAGFDALSLANNHTGDFGRLALVETVETLEASPISAFGAGRNLREASLPAVLEAGGTTFAFIGFNAIGETPAATDDGPGALSVRMPPRTGPLVRADLDLVTRTVERAARTADVVVVLPHWGTQYTHTPEPIQRQVARALVDAGADLVVGGHPHWVQGIDAVDGVPVLHSLGNFVFDMYWQPPDVREGVVLESTWWGDELKAIRLVPYAMEVGRYIPRPTRGQRAAGILADVWSTSTGPFSAAS